MKLVDNLSSLARHALELDNHFLELQRLSKQIESSSLDSDSEYQLAVKLLTKFTEKALGIENIVQEFSKSLDEARENSSHAVQVVAAKAQLIHQRKQLKDDIEGKLNELGSRVREVVASLSDFKNPGESDLTPEQKAPLTERLRSVESQLSEFILGAQSIKDQAQEIKFKDAYRSAESLHATLQNVKTKLGVAINTIH